MNLNIWFIPTIPLSSIQIELFLLIGVLQGNLPKSSPFSLHSISCFRLKFNVKRKQNNHSVLNITYIRLFTRHFFSANSILKPCIKSTRINISRNHSKSLNLPDLQDTVSNLRECIFSRL